MSTLQRERVVVIALASLGRATTLGARAASASPAIPAEASPRWAGKRPGADSSLSSTSMGYSDVSGASRGASSPESVSASSPSPDKPASRVVVTSDGSARVHIRESLDSPMSGSPSSSASGDSSPSSSPPSGSRLEAAVGASAGSPWRRRPSIGYRLGEWASSARDLAHLAARHAEALGQEAANRLSGGSSEMLGLWLFVLSTLFGTGMSLCAKLLNAEKIGVFEVIWVRSAFLIAFTAPTLIRLGVDPFADPQRRWLYCLRGLLGFGSVSTLYGAVCLLPMADANTLAFLAPLWAAALSPAVLGETPPRALVGALPVSLAGVLLVARPTFLFGGATHPTNLWGIAVGLVQSLFSATAKMAVRALNSSDELMAAIIFSMGAMSILGATVAVVVTRSFVLPTTRYQILLLAGNGLMGLGNQVSQTAALQRTKAASAIAMSYLSVIWGLMADIALFHMTPSYLSLLGAVIICGSSFVVAYFERRDKALRSANAAIAARQERRAAPDGEGVGLLEEGDDRDDDADDADDAERLEGGNAGPQSVTNRLA